MHEEGLQTLPRLLDAIGFRRGGLLGHSDGASIAAIFAGGVNDPRVTCLSLVAPHFFAEEFGLREIAKAREAYGTTDLRERLARRHNHVDVAFRGWNDAWLDPGFRAWDLTEYLPRIRVPVQVMQGADDPYGTRRHVDVVVEQSGGPVETEILAGVGHSPHREAPELALASIAGFFNRQLGGKVNPGDKSAPEGNTEPVAQNRPA